MSHLSKATTMARSPMNNIAAASNRIRKPDFFIIGAPKAGTTSLYHYLAAHPHIFMSPLKEPFFFCTDMPGLRSRITFVTDTAKYLNLFRGATDKHLACGEASSLYLLSKVAVPTILTFQPLARFIVMLRNPVELVHAHHSQLVRAMIEPVTQFQEAWKLQTQRAHGRFVPNTCPEPALLQYRQFGLLGEQVERLLSMVPPARVKILLLEELAANPRKVYEDLLTFLNVPYHHRTVFPKENAHRIHRSRFLARLIKTPPFPLNLLRDQYRRRIGIGTWPARVLAQLNGKAAKRESLSESFRHELEAEYHDDVRRLERVIQRDLSHWIRPRTSTHLRDGRSIESTTMAATN